MSKINHHVNLTNGNLITIECHPLGLKKIILQHETDISEDCIALLDLGTDNFISVKDSISQTTLNRERTIKVIDIKSQWQEFKAYKLQAQKLHENLEKEKITNTDLNQTIQGLTTQLEREKKFYSDKLMQQQSTGEQEKQTQISELLTKHDEEITNIRDEQAKIITQKEADRFKLEQNLNDEITNLNSRIACLQQDIAELNKSIREQDTTIKLRDDQIVHLQKENESEKAQALKQITDLNTNLNMKCYEYQQLCQQYQEYYQQSSYAFQQKNEQYEFSIQSTVEKHKKEIESSKQKYNSLSKERDELGDELNSLRITNNKLKQALATNEKKIQTQIKEMIELNQELDDLREKQPGDKAQVQDLQNKIKRLTKELADMTSNFNGEKETNATLKDQFEQAINAAQQKIDKSKNEVKDLTDQISELETQNTEKQGKIAILEGRIVSNQNQLKLKSDEYNSLQQQFSQQKASLQEKDLGENQIQKIIKDLNYQLDQKAKELIAAQKEIQLLTEKSNKSEQDLLIKTGQLKQEETKYQTQFRENTTLKEQLKSVSDQAKDYSKQMTEQINQVIVDMEKQKNESQYKDLVIKKIKEHFPERYIDKVVGTMDKIMNSEFKINDFTKEPNSQRDQTEYDVFEILIDQPKAKQLIKQSKWISFDECLQTNPLGNAKTTRSIQPNVDVTFVKGYMTQVEEAQNAELKGKKFLRKELKSQESPMFNKKEEAAKLSVNNFMCKQLLDQYNSDLDSCKLLSKREIKIQRQFVFQVKGKEEYFYCEMIEEGPYEKINGGQFVMKNSDIHQYLNAFSLYTYHLMKRQLIISNLQVAGNYLYDMIVSTGYQIFSSIDQGQSEIVNTIGVLEKAQKDNLGKCWNEQLEKKAKEGWK